jgi:hypothetical protein
MVYRHEKEEDMNRWQTFKKYINSREIGTIITRKEIMYHIYKGPTPPNTSSYGSTIDNYRKCLELLGILEVVSRGKYKLCYHIRNDISTSELQRTAYAGFRRWFNDVKVEGKAK